MSKHLLVGGLLLVLLATNLTWWRRTRRVKQSLAVSTEREQRIERDQLGDGADVETLAAAAERADCPPEELPHRIEVLRGKIGEAEREIDRLRGKWAQSRWEAAVDADRDPDEPAAVRVDLDRATTADVQAVADRAKECPRTIAILTAEGGQTIAITVGEQLREAFSAASIFEEIGNQAGCDGGGSVAFAIGGGCDPQTLHRVAADVHDRLENELPTQQ